MKYRKWIITTFLLVTLVSVALSKLVGVNYEFADYLPEDSKSTAAIDVMNEEFGQSVPNLRVVVYDVSIAQALEYKNKLQAVDGVEEITWLDDVINVYEPLEVAPPDTVDTWYKNQNALFSVTVDNNKGDEAINSIRSIIGEDNSMSGAAAINAITPKNTEEEVIKVTCIILPIVLLILLVTTTSWYEPFLLLFTIGVAILINRGTNLMFGTISFVTNAAGSVLQLAVSMDYSIFLLHRFADNRKEGMEVERAMKMAVKQSRGTILSSGLTTVTGFAALILMRFKIGPDMGWVMVKAIVISLLSVLCLLPALAVSTYKWIDKTTHRSFVPKFDFFAKLVMKLRIPMVAIFVLLLVPSFLASKNNQFLYGGSQVYNTEATQLGRDAIAIDELYGTESPVVLLVEKGQYEKEVALNQELKEIEGVTSVISYVNTVGTSIPEEFVPSDKLSQLKSEKYSRFIISLDTKEGMDNCFTLTNQIKEVASKYYGDSFHYAGDLVSTEDLKETISADDIKVNLLAITFVFLILLVTFRSITIPILLTLVIETSIWINLSVPYFVGSSLYYIGYLIISSVQLGATIDYAILLTERYKEYREGLDAKAAMQEAIKSCTLSVFTSASILACAGGTLGLISTNAVLSQLGTLLGRGAALSFLLVLFVLPILLVAFDKIIGVTTKNWPKNLVKGK